ncbi:LamG-like jellyroll fold domain-containing protein [Paenibacillus alkalitolerans]|uniref:LamG-like jellyroll fold domain-containing protein n=1 Tax=Paenibacillus alkalitolerans TaxID=2799335 RepID=UPI0018F3478F|nr:LamG-like jellyroll fold domain-containing protein [Paenibacillus alkalitolerans]
MSRFRPSPSVNARRISTTTGKVWSGAYEKLETTLTNSNYSPMVRPEFHSKKIVMLGSSTVDGTGASNANTTSMHALLKSYLSSAGFTVYNRGVGSDNTALMADRFYKDVIIMNPDYCILMPTMGNEGFHNETTTAGRVAVMNTLRNGILKLVQMCRQCGIVPVVATQWPTDRYDATHYQYARNFNAELEAMDFHVIDLFHAALDHSLQKALAAAVFDLSHYNDAGHRALAKSVPPSMFDKCDSQYGGLLRSPKGYILTGDVAKDTPITYTPTYALDSYTVALWFKIDTMPAASTTVFSWGTSAGERIIVDPDGALKYFTNGASTIIGAAGTVAAGTWYHIAITYNYISDIVDVYWNGAALYNVTQAATSAFASWAIGRAGTTAYCKHTNFKDVIIYRSKLTAEKIRQLYEGVISQAGLEMFAPLNDKVLGVGSLLTNLAPTNGNLQVNDGATTLTAVNAAAATPS